MFAAGGKRKFQTGKEAKKAAAQMAAEREAIQKLVGNEEEERRTEQILLEYREMRGPSLMDAHLQQLAKKPKTSAKNRGFDYDKVMNIFVLTEIVYEVDFIYYSTILTRCIAGYGWREKVECKRY